MKTRWSDRQRGREPGLLGVACVRYATRVAVILCAVVTTLSVAGCDYLLKYAPVISGSDSAIHRPLDVTGAQAASPGNGSFDGPF